MKRKGNFSLGRKNLIVLLVTLVMVMSSLLTACGSSAEATTVETKEEVVVDKVEETVVEEVSKEEVTEETVEEVAAPQSAKEWAQSIDTTEPKMTIWNDTLKEGIILENGQKYVLRQDDMLLFCTKEKQSGLTIDADLSLEDFKSSSSDNYVKIRFNKEFKEEIVFDIKLTVGGTEYPFSVTLVSESATATVSEDSESADMSGKDWASSLNYEEPKLLVWNDETGTKEVIDDGGQYSMNQNDVLAIYCPDEYLLTTTSPIEFAPGCTLINNFWRIEYVLPSESQTINLEVEMMNANKELVTINYELTTP